LDERSMEQPGMPAGSRLFSAIEDRIQSWEDFNRAEGGNLLCGLGFVYRKIND